MACAAIAKVLEPLYASIAEPARLPEFCSRLADATGSHVGAVMTQDLRLRGGRLDLVVGGDAQEAARYELEFAADNLWLQRGAHRLATGAVLDSDDFVPRRELRLSRYYNEYLRAHDVEQSAALCAHFDGKNVVTATVCRSGRLRPYSKHHLDVLRQVAPHWVNAYALLRRIKGLELRIDSLESAVDRLPAAVFLLDATGRLVRCNAAAQPLLSSGRLRSTPTGLAATGRAAVPFHALVRAATTGILHDGQLQRRSGNLALHAAEGPAGWVAAIHPLPSALSADDRSVAMLIVQPKIASDNPSLRSLLRSALDLTAAEAALAAALYRHADLAAAAEACGITVPTAKTRIQAVYDKTGEHGQAALMRLLAAIAMSSGNL